MRIKPEQLKAHLQKGLAPVYLVSGDVPLLVQEASDAIRQRARAEGCSERIVMNVESGFDWNGLQHTASGMSLFAERRLIELRLPTGKPGDAGSKALQAYAERVSGEDVLLIVAGKIDSAAQRSKWFKALDAAGVVVQVWPLEMRQLPAWITARMQEKGMKPSPDAVALLANRVEGNLLACAQEIEKLQLLYGGGVIDADALIAAVADSARFDIYALVDSALAGDGERTCRILQGLRGEGIEPILVLWALTREIRSLAGMAREMQQGLTIDQLLARYHVWEKRKPLVKQGLKRHPQTRWWQMLRRAGRIDRMIKGVGAGNVWDELLQLSLMVAGTRLIKMV